MGLFVVGAVAGLVLPVVFVLVPVFLVWLEKLLDLLFCFVLFCGVFLLYLACEVRLS